MHLSRKGGCTECQYIKGEYRLRTKDDLIHYGNLFHKNKYDYSRFVFVDGRTKGEIICSEHGSFYMHPNNHLANKAGCLVCGKTKAGASSSKTKHGGKTFKEKFHQEAPKVHKEKYDYKKIPTNWTGRTKDIVTIICPVHGEFLQQADLHIKGYGCLDCGYEKNAKKKRKSQEKFISECINKWGHEKKYYSLVNYRGRAYQITLICSEHGSFSASAKGHLGKGYGCPKCAGRNKTTEEIIKLSREKHGDQYDYSKVIFTKTHDKITIICKVHGEFYQRAVGHYLNGYGCPDCGQMKSGLDGITHFKLDKKRADSFAELYIVSIHRGKFIKIGIAENTKKRDRLYDDFLYIRRGKRSTVWCVEQQVLLLTKWAVPKKLPKDLKNWSGKSELRNNLIPLDEIKILINHLFDECTSIGWKKFADKYDLPNVGSGWHEPVS